MTAPRKGPNDYLALGDWNAICAECGRKGKASQMVKLPEGVPGAGMYVHMEHWFPRQPQDFVRGIPDNQAAPWVQNPPATAAGVCDLWSQSSYVDLAAVDCCIIEYDPPLPDLITL